MRNKIFSYVMLGTMVLILGFSIVLLTKTNEINENTANTNVQVASSTVGVATKTSEIATKVLVATPIATCTTILEPEETQAVTETVQVETSTTIMSTEELVVEGTSVTDAPIEEVIEAEPAREYYVYKPSTHYIHKSTCHWVSSECYEITETSGIEARACSECDPKIEIVNPYVEETTEVIVEEDEEETHTTSSGLTYVKNFSRGTYYAYGGARTGGSGRSLIDCSYGDGYVKGSIASSYLYRNYGYNYNGNRTMVYLEISGYPSMNGYYYLDDSDAGNSNVIDFFYISGSNCIFRRQGVVSVDCYLVN